jgi:hypothetical protein
MQINFSLSSGKTNEVLCCLGKKEIPFCLFKLQGKKAICHHWHVDKALQQQLIQDVSNTGNDLYKLWDEADIIVCCHPEGLPSNVLYKHIFPSHKGLIFMTLYPSFWGIKNNITITIE